MRLNPTKCISILILLFLITYTGNLFSQSLLSSDFSNPKTINEDLFGFNAGFMMEVCGVSDDSLYAGIQPPLNSYYLNESCTEIINQINPSVIRFPGGTGANYYHFYGNGYGFIPSEVFGSKFESLVGTDQWIPENYIVNFADLALQTGSKTIYVANLFTHFKQNGLALTDPTNAQYQYKLKENLDAIEYLIARGVEIVGVELGNELYSFIEVNNTSGNRTKYLNLARVYADSIKARYPNMPVGVPIQPVGGAVDLAFNPWNKAMKFADFADAYIIHEYERKVRNFCTETNDRDIYFNCAKQKLDEFIDPHLKTTLKNYWDFYGRSKKFWLTEWNMLDPQLVANTYLHAYFLTKYWNNMMQIDKDNPGNVTITNCHNLISGGYLYPAVGILQPNESPSLIVAPETFVQRAAYFAHTMMSPLLSGNSKYVGQTKINQHQTWIYKAENGEYDLVVINDSGEEAILSKTTVEGIILENIDAFSFTKLSQLSAANLYDAAGVNYFNTSSENVLNELSFINNSTQIDPNYLLLPNNSISVIRVGEGNIDSTTSITNLVAHIQNCIVQINWTVTNDADGLVYVIEQNNIPIDTIASFGNNAVQNYNITYQPEINGNYNYVVKVYQNNILSETTTIAAVNLDCVETPLPEFTLLQVTDIGNCQLNFTWRLANNIPNSYFLVAITYDNVTFIDTVQGSLATLYSYTYAPPSNGDYQFQIVVYENGEFLAVSDVTNTNVTCVYTPPFIVDYTIVDNSDCTYSLRWTVANEQTISKYVISANYNTTGYANIHTQFSSGNFTLKDYEYVFTPEEDGNFQFKIEHHVNNVLQNTRNFNTLDVTCVPEPVPVMSNFIVSEVENCAYEIEWQVMDELQTSTYLIYAEKEGETPILIEIVDAQEAAANVQYQTFHLPEENGSYTYEIVHLISGVEVNNATQSLDVNCIVIPAPELANLSVALVDDCTYQIGWNVTYETPNSAYSVIAFLDGNSIGEIYSIASTNASDNAQYGFEVSPNSNGNYVIEIQQFIDGIYVASATSTIIPVTCIITPPAMKGFAVLNNGNCTYQINWVVSDEVITGSYAIKASLNQTGYETIAIIPAQEANALVNYSYNFVPEENGDYEFQVDRLENSVVYSSTSVLTQTVECIIIPSSLDSIAITEGDACNFILNWTVSNEVTGNSYELQVAYEGEDFETIHVLESSENGAFIHYSFDFAPTENGSYAFQVNQIENEIVLDASQIVYQNVNCIIIPSSIDSIAITEGDACNFILNWTVSNEVVGNTYELQVAYEGGDFETIHVLESSENGAFIHYSFDFAPTENGSYAFQVNQIENGNVLDASQIVYQNVNCIIIPSSLDSIAITEGDACNFILNWTVSNEVVGNTYELQVAYEGGDFETIHIVESTQNGILIDYNFGFTPTENGKYRFQVIQIENGNVVQTTNLLTYDFTCVAAPLPSFALVQVTDNGNCQLNFTWRMDNHIPNCYFIVVVSQENSTFMDTVQGSMATLYSYSYIPESNGDYEFRVAVYENESLLVISEPSSTSVTCVYTPPFIIDYSIIDNEDCTYTLQWTVANEQLNSRYDLKSNFNGGNYTNMVTQFSTGNYPVIQYEYVFSPDEDGTYQFKVDQYVNYVPQTTEYFVPLNITCAPDPNPIMSNFSIVEESNCVLKVKWQVSGELTTSSYKVYVRRNNEALSLINTVASTFGSGNIQYEFDYIPELNGTYTFEIEQFNNNIVIANAAQTYEVSCVTVPDPVITNLEVVFDGNCTYTIDWAVADESSTSTYTVFVTLEGDTLSSIFDTISVGAAASTLYSFDYLPEVNGSYTIVVQHFNEGLFLNEVSSAVFLVECIVIPPSMKAFTVSENPNCSYTLNWVVSDEVFTSSYDVKVNFNDLVFETIEQVHAQSEGGIVNYTYTFFPEENGNYQFQIDQLAQNVWMSSSAILTKDVTCVFIPAALESFNYFTDGECTFNLEWTVSNEVIGNAYELQIAYEGGAYQTVQLFESIEEGALIYYNYSFSPEENGSYDLRVKFSENGGIAESNNDLLLDIDVDCITEILPILNVFNVTSTQNCSATLSWNVTNQDAGTQIIIKEKLSSNAFTTIATLNGNSNQPNGSYTVSTSGTGNYKYIIEIYQNGSFVTSSNLQTINVYCPLNVSLSLDVYPFLTFGDFNVNISVNQPLQGTIQIVSIFFGNVVHSQAVNLVAGSNSFSFDMDNYFVFSGLYRVIFSYSGGTESESFIYF